MDAEGKMRGCSDICNCVVTSETSASASVGLMLSSGNYLNLGEETWSNLADPPHGSLQIHSLNGNPMLFGSSECITLLSDPVCGQTVDEVYR